MVVADTHLFLHSLSELSKKYKRSLKQFHMPAEEPGFQALSTKRLILRKPELNDAREIFNLRSNEQVNQYLDRHPATDLEDATDFLNKIIQSIDGGEGSYWAICLKENPRLVGTICLYDFSPDRQTAEIGYELLPFYQHKGIMQEAMSVVLHYSFHTLNLETITAFPSADNKSSIKLLQKNEFKLEDDGVQRDGNFVRYVLRMP